MDRLFAYKDYINSVKFSLLNQCLITLICENTGRRKTNRIIILLDFKAFLTPSVGYSVISACMFSWG